MDARERELEGRGRGGDGFDDAGGGDHHDRLDLFLHHVHVIPRGRPPRPLPGCAKPARQSLIGRPGPPSLLPYSCLLLPSIPAW